MPCTHTHRGYEGARRTLGMDATQARLSALNKAEREEAAAREAAQQQQTIALHGDSRKRQSEAHKEAVKAAKETQDRKRSTAQLGATLSKMGLNKHKQGFAGRAFGGPGASRFGKPPLPAAAKADAGDAGAGSSVNAPAPAEEMANGAAADGDPQAAASAGGTSSDATAGAAGNGPDADADSSPFETHAAPLPGEAEQAGGLQRGAATMPAAGPSSAVTGAGSAALPQRNLSLQQQLLSLRSHALKGGALSRQAGDSAVPVEVPLQELTLRDLIVVLERDPMYCRSPLLYSLYGMWHAEQAAAAAPKEVKE